MSVSAPVRRWVAAGLIVAGLLTTAIGIPALYVRTQIIAERPLEDRLVAAVQTEEVRGVAAQQIVNGLIDAGATDLLSVRSVLVPAIGALLDTPSFAPIMRLAARDAHRVFIQGQDDSLVLDLGQGSALLASALRSVSPDIADALPADVDPQLISIHRDEPALRAVRRLAGLHSAGLWLPLVALVLIGAGVAVAPNRRGTLGWAGGGVALIGGLLALTLAIARELTVREVEVDLLTGAETRAAVKALWDSLLADLSAWAGIMVIGGAAVAIVGGGVLEPDLLVRRLGELARRLARRPPTRALRAARGLAAVFLGALLALEPGLVGAVVALIGGLGILLWGLAEAAMALEAREVRRGAGSIGRMRLVVPGAGALLVVTATALAALLITGPGPKSEQAAAQASPRVGCLGSKDLCGARLNEVSFAATHNSFSAADEPGWLFPNQRFGIQRQLDNGIRGFYVDLHLGARDAFGILRTDLKGERQDRNRVGRRLGPEGLAMAEQIGRVGSVSTTGPSGVYMCHTLCELGYEPAVDQLRILAKFLLANPGEVLVVDVESFVEPDEVERVFSAAGLLRYVHVLDRHKPLPTLGEMVSSGQRLVVLAEHDGGTPPWYLPAYSFTQDTPLGAKSASELSCRRARGDRDSPLFTVNHWIDVFPPRPQANALIGGRFLRDRLARCARERELTPNIVAVDFYDTSGVIAAVNSRNRRAARRVARRSAALLRERAERSPVRST